ncbi:UvrD-helicase domain-containing protein [Enterococcus faecalis]|uniref:UvrD-helicase domain-containing protein n=1 Tax=Enterococcus faecalis TaxID=1351 RepID=UPI003D2696E6
MNITDDDIQICEELLLPSGCNFTEEQIKLIKCLDSTEIIACPGSGKTTLLLAKLLSVTNHYPLKHNSGVCVLSHTNVAINEIQDKFDKKIGELNSYPNFIGTIQSFIDKFVVFPYLTRFTSEQISILDQESYSNILWETAKANYPSFGIFYSFINKKAENLQHISSPVDYVKDLKSDSDKNLLYKEKIITNKDSESAKQFANLKNFLLTKGITNFNDTYLFANLASKHFGEELNNILSKRFSYVFIDEYQDCDEVQRNVLDTIFNSSNITVQKIGDMDQAIFSSQNKQSSIWVADTNALHMRGSNRYHQAIANEVVKLRTNHEKIDSLVTDSSINPCLIVFDDSCIDEVVPTFAKIIKENEILCSSSSYPIKAIGMIKNSTGLTISDYWKKYKLKTGNDTNSDSFPTCIESIKEALLNGNLASVHSSMISIFKKIFILCGKRTNTGGLYSESSIKQYLLDQTEGYKDFLLTLTNIDFNNTILYKLIIDHIKKVLDENEFQYETVQKYLTSGKAEKNNESVDYVEDDLKIIFETIYKTKGETHLATLYLETETSNSSDIKRCHC